MKTFAETMVELEGPLDKNSIKTHPYNGQKYLEGYVVINHANKVFGYDGWSYELRGVKDIGGGLWEAVVKVTVNFDGVQVSREDVGLCAAAVNRETNEISRESHDTAVKGAVTDALKRALRTFGAQFGNSLYDKDYIIELKEKDRQAESAGLPTQQRQASPQSTAQAQQANTKKSPYRIKGEESTAYSLEGVPSSPPPCPKCHGEMYDNIASQYWNGGMSKSGTSKKPVFSCKDKGCGHSIWAESYQNGVLPDEYYPAGENPNTNATPPEPAPPVAEDNFPDEAQVVDLEFKAEKIWGPGAWLEGLRQTSYAMIGTEEYATASPEQLNKLQGFIDTLKPSLEKAA